MSAMLHGRVFYSSPDWTNQILALERANGVFFLVFFVVVAATVGEDTHWFFD